MDAHAERFHDSRERNTGKNFRGYVSDKVRDKGRKYNTLKNRDRTTDEAEQARRKRNASAYRATKDGE